MIMKNRKYILYNVIYLCTVKVLLNLKSAVFFCAHLSLQHFFGENNG